MRTWRMILLGSSAASAYKLQFFSLMESSINKIVWKAWAPPKVKNDAWLALQSRLWTVDRLRRRGWENYGLCPLCKQTKKNHNHLFVHCRFTTRIWELLKEWLGIQGVFPRHWAGLNIGGLLWWRDQALIGRGWLRSPCQPFGRFGRNETLVFCHKLSHYFIILDKIKYEARLWITAGVKRLDDLMPRE
jgi:hypothetical protein